MLCYIAMKSTTATSTFNLSLVTFPSQKNLLVDRLDIASLTRARHLNIALCSSTRALTMKCCKNGSPESISGQDGGNFKDILSGMVDKHVEELLNKEENRVLLDGLEKATLRVEMAKRELAEIEKQEIEAKMMRDYINQLESRASEIAECQNEIFQARAMVEEAEQYLTVDGRGGVNPKKEGMMGKNEERLESIKAASLSAIIGTLAGLPISFARVTSYSELILNVAITFVSCALFGVTFRYAIRRDLDNFQLKSGIAAAFGFVKGLATLEGGPPLQLDSDSIITYTFHGAVYISEDLLIFLFAAVGLDFFIKLRILRPFPTDQSVPKTKFVK